MNVRVLLLGMVELSCCSWELVDWVAVMVSWRLLELSLRRTGDAAVCVWS